jgi:hypothetical protein
MLENEDHGYGKHFYLNVQYMLLKSIYEQGEFPSRITVNLSSKAPWISRTENNIDIQPR